MSDSLIIVESPTKVRTIKKYLGANFAVRATMGHVKDLPKSGLGIDMKNHFAPTYRLIETKKKVIADLKRAARRADHIYLAPDPDREGEAIAWHIAEEIGAKDKHIHRVLFNDLTKSTILHAINHPGELDVAKYEAQQTRRILDRLVGYQISPLLWEKVRRGLSAGRVQSVAVRIVCDREEEIRRFVSEEYWNITAHLECHMSHVISRTSTDLQPTTYDLRLTTFKARLLKIKDKKAKVADESQAKEILNIVKTMPFVVAKVEKKEIKRFPLPPFTTSKLQQEAARWLHFPAKKTMSVAQRLYEGIELGEEGPVGLITYMRTDSFRIAEEALRDAREYIRDNYDPAFLPVKARVFKNPAKVQDAHEAIRPASVDYKPKDIKQYLSNDQFRLYQLIWNRFVASQMNPAIFDQTIIDITAGGGGYLFRAQGSVMRFSGYTIVYTEGKDASEDEDDFGMVLPEVAEGEALALISLSTEQKFTQPPPRFSEATLVRELEEKGIGRPSTYATILSTIQERNYVHKEKVNFYPTDLGILITELLVRNFPRILDVAFTAALEDKLDLIEEGKNNRLDTLNDFYIPFAEELKKARAEMRNIKGEETPTDIVCDKCGNVMVIKWGKNGKFIACSNYPACKNTMNIAQGEKGQMSQKEEEITDTICECGRNMVVKEGRFGKFLGCSGYPECKNTMPLSCGVRCPEKECSGYLCERRTKKGKTFFGCSRYPDCTYALWDRPRPTACPQCGAPFLVEKPAPPEGTYLACLHKDCGYKNKET
ncbi:MAG: type I DNA topoisomerase [Syntrophales bacterium]|nr:type I DNA topoisomerase [Syntrophales bacterium]